MKRLLFILLTCICCLTMQAQGNFGKVSAETADFVRFGNQSVSLYTGQVSVSVPLYHIKDKDFDIPLSLNYAAEGFKPTSRPGWVGLHWSLSGAGVVTREIYGVPDDFSNYVDSNGEAAMGFWQAVQQRTYSPDDLFSFNDNLSMICGSGYCTLPPVDGKYYDCEPDLFTFSMPGHHATFMIDNRGNVQTSQKGYKVILNNMTAQTTANANPSVSEITIIAPDGYQYVFGGTMESLEFSTNRKTGFLTLTEDMRTCINAWHLTQIKAPNGRTLTYSYTSHDALSISSPFWSVNSASLSSLGTNYQCNVTKRVFLSSITVADTGASVQFNKTLETCSPFYAEFTDYNALSYKLDNVTVKQGTTTKYIWQLGYENKQHLRFLSQVTLPDGGVYSFGYLHSSSYPRPTTEEVDAYGFWPLLPEYQYNGSGNSGSGNGDGSDVIDPTPDGREDGDTIDNGLYPIYPNPPSTPVEVPDREAYSLMTRVNYPTGGYTLFTYEQHRYGKRVNLQVSGNSWGSYTVTRPGKIGGQRIKTIEDHHVVPGTDIDQIESRSYTYMSTDGTTGSGFLMKTRPFMVMATTNDTIAITNKVWANNYNIEEPHIGYSHVTETYGDGSYIQYQYSDYSSNPDGNVTNYHWEDASEVDGMDFVTSNVALKSSNYNCRGLLLRREHYTSDGTQLHGTSYTYRDMGALSMLPPGGQELISLEEYGYIVSFRPVDGGAGTMGIRLRTHPVLTEVETEYPVSGGSHSRTLTYTYNELDLMRTRKEARSDGRTFITSYLYPSDLNTLGSVYSRMVTQNRVASVVEERDSLGTTLTAVRCYLPKMLTGGGFVTDSIQESRNGTDYATIEKYPEYDSYGNPVHIVRRDGTEQVLFWGYKGRYLIGVVEGSTYGEVVDALGGTLPASFSGSETPTLTAIDGLRNSLEGAAVTTYVYSPLVGLTKATLPNGNVMTYLYNSAGELIESRDVNGSKVETYSKHYKE